MSRSVSAIGSGLDYQARFFWWQAACRLLDPDSPVVRVGFDVSDHPGFDDVVVERAAPERDGFGREIFRDCFQVKFHVDQSGVLNAEALTDPRAIGGVNRSLLDRLRLARDRLGAGAAATRMHLVTTYGVDHQDLLARLVGSNDGGEIRLHELAKGGPRSKAGRLRAHWREHLGFKSDRELFDLLKLLRIWKSAPDLAHMQNQLDRELTRVGLRPGTGTGAESGYDDLIWKLHREGTEYFDADSLREECRRSNLVGQSASGRQSPRRAVGIRSFRRPGVDLGDRVDDLLSFVDLFDGRFLVAGRSWEQLGFELRGFLVPLASAHEAVDLYLDTHASLAFATGSVCEPKLGLEVGIQQRSRAGVDTWSTTSECDRCDPDLEIASHPIGEGDEVALALAITHDVEADVRASLASQEVHAGRLVVVRPTGGAGQGAVRDGAHALAIADAISRTLKARSVRERSAALHLYSAAPNALLFFLGQLSPSFGRTTLYEFDFEGTRGGGYLRSLTLPIPVKDLTPVAEGR